MEAMNCYFLLDAYLPVCVWCRGRGLSGFSSGSCHSPCWSELCLLCNNFFYFFIFFYSVKPSFSVFILPCNNLSFLYVTVSSLVHIMYAIWSKDSFQMFLLGMVVSLIGLKPHWWTLVFFAIWNLDLRYICVLKSYDICELRNANNAILTCCIWNSILSNYLFVYLNLAPLA